MTTPHTGPGSSSHPEALGFWRSRYALGLLVMGAIASYFLLSEHRAHFIGALPLLLLLACPLMHVFMHNGHGGHGGDGGDGGHGSGHAGHHDAKAPPSGPTTTTGERS